MIMIDEDDPIPMDVGGFRNRDGGSDDEENYAGNGEVEVISEAVSGVSRCLTEDAKHLCIYDVAQKLAHPGDYDIGGTHGSGLPELWFYYTTSLCPNNIHLLNLFVCHRKCGSCVIKVSESSEATHINPSPGDTSSHSELTASLASYTIFSSRPDQHHYIKTYCFTKKDIDALKNTLLIPIQIQTEDIKVTLKPNVIRRIKLAHDFGNLLSDKEKTDFVLESSSGKKFNVHKIIVVAHSPVLRDRVRDSRSASLKLDINDEDLELLLEFLYTGTIREVLKQDCLKLLGIAELFELKNMFNLVQYVINKQIDVNNAVDVVVLSEKYNLEQLQANVFRFIKDNPAVLETDGWRNLDNVHLTKKMFKYIYSFKK